MSEQTRPGRSKRMRLIAPLIIACLIVGLIAVALGVADLRRRAALRATHMHAVFRPPPRPPPPVPDLTRADFVSMAAAAADSYSEGRTPRPDNLAGRRFQVRLAFGCNSAEGASSLAPATVDRGETGDTLHVVARPIDFSTLPMIADDIGERIEAVEGFWIPRPWLRSENCPAAHDYPTPAVTTPVASQTVGLARLFGPDDARTDRHNEHPYEFTQRSPASEPSASGGAARAGTQGPFFLVLRGQVAAFPDGAPIRCRGESPDHRPVCLFAVRIDHVAVVDSSGESLAEWGP